MNIFKYIKCTLTRSHKYLLWRSFWPVEENYVCKICIKCSHIGSPDLMDQARFLDDVHLKINNIVINKETE